MGEIKRARLREKTSAPHDLKIAKMAVVELKWHRPTPREVALVHDAAREGNAAPPYSPR